MALVTVQRSPTPSTTSSPCVSEADSGEEDRHSQPRSISESFLTVKGAALFLPRGNASPASSVPRITQRRNTHTGDLQQHLQTMFTLLRPEDTIRLAVRLESAYPQCTRYMVVVSSSGRQDTEESVVLGMDFSSSDRSLCSVGLVLPLWSDTLIHLDGDGGFSVSTANRVHVFKPVSVQAMWSALQSLHKACEVARCHNYYPGSLFLTWVSYYQSRVSSDQLSINEWNAMQDVESRRADSPVLFTDVPTERERTERLIKTRLREIMMQKDLENVTSKEIRTELEMQMVCNLRLFKEYIDNEMIVILGQMDSPTEIFDHVFLGSEWNASNLEELQSSGVRYILNVTREIDNFFPGQFEYHNIRVYDEEATNLLEYWNETFKFISKAKKAGAKCLVHCKMGVSRSASTVIAYAMKEYGWSLERAFDYVKERRAVTKPNPSFMRQLEEYQGILLASKQRHNKLWRSHSDGDLSTRRGPPRKTPHTLGSSDPRNLSSDGPASLRHFLGLAVLRTLRGDGDDGRPEEESRPAPEDPLLPGPARPRAATAAPERSAEGPAPATRPRPPSSLHLLPPASPSEASASDGGAEAPERKADPAEPSADTLETDSELSQRSRESSVSGGPEVPPDTAGERGGSPASPGTPMTVSPLGSPSGPPTVLGLLANDDSSNNNNNNHPGGDEADGMPVTPVAAGSSSSLGTDRIDFFSAREKFLSLSQDGPARSPSEQAAPRTPQSRCPSQELQTEDPSAVSVNGGEHGKCSPSGDRSPLTDGPPPQHDSGVSVRHIVTELESISQPAPPRGPPPQQPRGGEAPAESPRSRPPGSVRRVTEQLELRLQQQLEAPPGGARSPPPSLPGSAEVECEAAGRLRGEDADRPARPAHSGEDLEKIQETLRELQAFLHEAGGPARRGGRAPAVWQRAMAIEARIRQAGLTPPSLMKRSASLAKLDCLELSADDLSDWDFYSPPGPRPPAAPRPHPCPDDAHKKQRVLPQGPPSPSPPPAPPSAELVGTEGSASPPRHRQRSGTLEHAHSQTAPPAVSVATRQQQQQHSKGHPVRRHRKAADKKKTVTVLYNTM